MSSSRPSVTQLLSEKFEQDPTLRARCQASAKLRLKNNLARRFFDEFPPLVPDDEVIRLLKKYQKIITSIKPSHIDETPKSFRLTHKEDEVKINTFVTEIIRMGMTDLIDQEGFINEALLTLLNLKADAITPTALISAYVGSIYQSICNQISKDWMEKNQYVAGTVFIFLNKHYGNWVEEKLNLSAEYIWVDRDETPAAKMHRPVSHHYAKFFIGSTIAALGVGLLLKAQDKKSEPISKLKTNS